MPKIEEIRPMVKVKITQGEYKGRTTTATPATYEATDQGGRWTSKAYQFEIDGQSFMVPTNWVKILEDDK